MQAYWKSIFPFLGITAILIGVYLSNDSIRVSDWGLHPRSYSYFYTAFTGAFLHGDAMHLWGNIISFIGLSTLFVLLFPKDGIRFFLIQWVLSSVLLFFIAQGETLHIGASTWLFSFFGFLFYYTLRAKNRRLKAIFLVLILWYGSMWWGLLPLVPHISYEGHLSGLITGMLMAFCGATYWNRRLLPEWHYKPKEWEQDSDLENPYDTL